MSKDQNELLLLGSLSPGIDRAFLERLQACVSHRNAHGATPTPALQHEDGDRFKQIVVGPSHIAFLTNDNQVFRLKFDINEVKTPPVAEKAPAPAPAASASGQGGDGASGPPVQQIPPPGSNAPGPPGASIAAINAGNNASVVSQFNAANRNAKMRRVMMATRRAGAGFTRGGVIIDRSRALIPAANIPEDLIAQAQVVLQGKSREVIVRELQRTNLNVNEAVNNLLSREDDEEEFDEAGDTYLPEELLSILDAGLRNPEGFMEAEGLSALADSTLMARFAVRRRDTRDRPRERVVVDTVANVREKFEFGDKLESWTADEKMFPPNVTAFEKIGAMNGELIALANNGLLYSWKWTSERGADTPHHINAIYLGQIDLENQKDRITDVETCAYRCAVLTSTNKVGSFADEITVGTRVAEAMFQPLVDVPDTEIYDSLHVCSTFTAIKTKSSLYWWGIMPFVERRRVFEKTRSRAKKFTTNTADIKIGVEVRTKSNPVYAANSIAVNLQSGVPTIGVMMESAWSINETCRFRTYTPAQFDLLKDDVLLKDDKRAVNLSVRKRAAPSDEQHPGSSSAPVPHKETAWAIKEVFFIHEESCNDIGVVQIVDGAICGIHFKTYIDEKQKSGDGSQDLHRLRLMRKEELVIVQGGARQPTSPVTFERTLQRVLLPIGIRRVVSTVVDNSGFRLLVEKKGRLHLLRLTTLGKIASDHVLPMSCSAVCGPADAVDVLPAKLLNYGDSDILVLQDYKGYLIPLIRDATSGYSAPPYVGFTNMKNLALGVQYMKSSADTSSPVISSAPIDKLNFPDSPRSGNKLLFIASLFPNAVVESPEIQMPSLTQHALFCDYESVKRALTILEGLKEKLSPEAFHEFMTVNVVEARADGNRNILHIAVMSAFAKTNAHQNDADAGTTAVKSPTPINVTTTTPEGPSTEKPEPEPMEVDIVTKPVSDPVQRQKNAVKIIELITSAPILTEVLAELMQQRDINGHTPYISAIQNRAYGAAITIWNSMRVLYGDLSVAEFTNKVYNPLQHYDDSPLFILAYNDTCSFTWTGDEHINQDIFECRTCGLVGSLCCCTECAQTCHRNHDCKLKRTSPTAYCDCWERCPCKALVAGNDNQREWLMVQLLDYTNLIERPNQRGEHLLLFLVKTVGRQLYEQGKYSRKTNRPSNSNAAAAAAAAATNQADVPERDLEPPKFAQRALAFCLIRWEAIKSLVSVGVKEPKSAAENVSEDVFHLHSQNGSTHLDKFVFLLLAKCHQSHLDGILNTIISVVNLTTNPEDPSNVFTTRFVRSVIRLFAIVNLASPHTIAQTSLSVAAFDEEGYEPKYSNSEEFRAPSQRSGVASMLSLVRSMPAIFTERSNKDYKTNTVDTFVAKCRRVFQALTPHAIVELMNGADAYLSPVATGFINPTVSIATAMASHDPLDYIERHLMSEQDLSSFLDPLNETKTLRRRRYGSRHNADDEAVPEAPVIRAPPPPYADSDNSDSDSENEAASRRFSSQGSLHGQALESLHSVVRNYRRVTGEQAAASANNNAMNAAAVANAAVNAAGDAGVRALSLSSSSEDSSDDSNDDESETDRVFGAIDEFNNEFDDDEEVRENDEEGDDYYDDEEGDEAPNDFAEDEEGSGNDDDEYDELASPAVIDENAHPPADEPMDADPPPAPLLAVPTGGVVPAPAPIAAPIEVYVPAEPHDGVDAMIQHEEVAVDVVPGEEVVDDDDANPRAVPFAVFRQGNNSRRPPPPQSSRSLTWAVPSLRANDADVGNDELVIRTAMTSTTNDPTPRSNTKTENPEDMQASTEKTALQFTATFCTFIRIVDDLLLYLSQFHLYSEKGQYGIPNLLNLDYQNISNLRQYVDKRLLIHWKWLTTVLDKVEAQLKFGTVLNQSPASAYLNLEPEKPSESKKSDDKRKAYVPKKSGDSSGSSGQKKEQHQNRRDFLQYFLSLSRSHAHENGDELPIMEYRSLRSAALVAEAYLFHTSIADIFDVNIGASPDFIAHNRSINSDFSGSTETGSSIDSEPFYVPAKELHRFFQRPPPLCYPCITNADDHNAFSYNAEDCLPLAVRSQMLLPDVEKAQLFALPNPQRTMSAHVRAGNIRGVLDLTLQSLGVTSGVMKDTLLDESSIDPEVAKHLKFATYQQDLSLVRTNPHLYTLDDVFAIPTTIPRHSLYRVLSRWSNTFSLITQMFTDDLVLYCGGDASYSVTLVETGSFQFRQSQFRRRIEKIKNFQLRDLSFSGVVREKSAMILQTFRMLNQQYARRLANTGVANQLVSINTLRLLSARGDHGRIEPLSTDVPPPPLAAHKVKVTFKDEPGEGTGVARSFYSAVADALSNLQYIPIDGFEVNDEADKRQRSSAAPGSSSNAPVPAKRLTRSALQALFNAIQSSKRSAFKRAKHTYNLTASLFSPTSEYTKHKKDLMPVVERGENPGKEKLGDVVFATIHAYEPSFAQRVTGIVMDLSDDVLLDALKNIDTMHLHVIEIIRQLQAEGYVNSFDKESTNPVLREDAPFFTRLSSNGHFIPLIATGSPNRINGFRNVGRMIGLCLQQREIFPLQLARHVFQFILGQPLTWFDCAFFDPVLFDALRVLAINDENGESQHEDFFENLCLSFITTTSEKEGARVLEMIKNGDKVHVVRDNILEYFYHYVHTRLHGPNLPALEAIRSGIFDVIPADSLQGLTPEDFRLILCGSSEINLNMLESYTKFLDESSSSSDVLEKYKQTFWSVVSKFTNLEKQDLVFFWTGSPTLPATEEEFQPLPTIMVRPSDQNLHLPTANTCISRLYLPLYSSKKILRSKLLLAIKSRNFGFV